MHQRIGAAAHFIAIKLNFVPHHVHDVNKNKTIRMILSHDGSFDAATLHASITCVTCHNTISHMYGMLNLFQLPKLIAQSTEPPTTQSAM